MQELKQHYALPIWAKSQRQQAPSLSASKPATAPAPQAQASAPAPKAKASKPPVVTFNLLSLTGNKASTGQQAKALLEALESALSAQGYSVKAGIVRCTPEMLQQALATAEAALKKEG